MQIDRRRAWIVSLFIFACLIITASCYATNLITDPGFEESSDIWQPNSAAAQIVNTTSFVGSKSGEVLGRNSSKKYTGWYRNVFDIQSNGTCYFSTWYKAENMAGKILFKFDFYNGDTWVFDGLSSEIIGSSDGWDIFSWELPVPTNTTRAILSMRVYGTGDVWFDEVYFGSEPRPSLQLVGNNLVFSNANETVEIPIVINPFLNSELAVLKGRVEKKSTQEVVLEKDFLVGLTEGAHLINIDMSLLQTKAYVLYLTIVDNQNSEISSGELFFRIRPEFDNEPPLPVEIEADNSIPGAIILTWTVPQESPIDEDLPDRYIIYRGTSESFIPNDANKIHTLEGTEEIGSPIEWMDVSVQHNLTYYYQVASEDISGNKAFSNKVSKFVFPTEVPKPVEPNLTSAPTSSTLVFKWEGLENVEEYYLEISSSQDFNPDTTDEIPCPGSKSEYIMNTSLSPGKWFWRIRARFNNETMSSYSEELTFYRIVTEEEADFIPYVLVVPEVFNPNEESTFITYVIKESGEVSAAIFSPDGKKMVQLAANEPQEPGTYQYIWKGTTNNKKVNPGLYYLKVTISTLERKYDTYKKILVWY